MPILTVALYGSKEEVGWMIAKHILKIAANGFFRKINILHSN